MITKTWQRFIICGCGTLAPVALGIWNKDAATVFSGITLITLAGWLFIQTIKFITAGFMNFLYNEVTDFKKLFLIGVFTPFIIQAGMDNVGKMMTNEKLTCIGIGNEIYAEESVVTQSAEVPMTITQQFIKGMSRVTFHNYYLVVGVFENVNNAYKLANVLKDKYKIEAKILNDYFEYDNVKKEKTNKFIVVVFSSMNQEEVYPMLEQWKSKGYSKSFIWDYEK